MAYPISVIQLDIDFAHPESNRDAALALSAEAIARGARLVVLPEACVTDLYRGAEAFAEHIPGPMIEAFSKISGAATIALPMLEKSAEGIFSSCALIGASGVKGVARKTHLYRDPSGLDQFSDAEIVRAGNELGVFEAGDLRIGVALGYDAEFPEVFRTFALKGADAILAVLNCVEPDTAFLSEMARRNRVAIAVANRIGFKRIYPAAPEFSASAAPIVQDKRGEFLIRCIFTVAPSLSPRSAMVETIAPVSPTSTSCSSTATAAFQSGTWTCSARLFRRHSAANPSRSRESRPPIARGRAARADAGPSARVWARTSQAARHVWARMTSSITRRAVGEAPLDSVATDDSTVARSSDNCASNRSWRRSRVSRRSRNSGVSSGATAAVEPRRGPRGASWRGVDN